MKNRRAFVAKVAILLLAAGLLLFREHRPFRGLEAGDIIAASVRMSPLDVTTELNRGEIEMLAELLRDVRVTRRDSSYTKYEGQAVSFTLSLADGTTTDVMAYALFLAIGSAG